MKKYQPIFHNLHTSSRSTKLSDKKKKSINQVFYECVDMTSTGPESLLDMTVENYNKGTEKRSLTIKDTVHRCSYFNRLFPP